jgi:outer membrane protein
MKYRLLFGFLFLFLLSFRPQAITAQNIVYVNSAAILAELPDVKRAEAELELLQQRLRRQGQSMVEQFQKDVSDLERQVGAGELSPRQQQEEAKRLEERQSAIGKLEQDMVQQLQNKRTELLEPIYEKVNIAIDQVRKENGHQIVLDQQVILAAEDYLNITPLVRSKLGM